MFSRTKLFSASLTLALFVIISAVGLAQQPQNQNQNQSPGTNEGQRPFGRGESRGFRHGPGPRRIFDPRLMRELNLTDDQRQQIRQVVESDMESTKGQREELRQLIDKKTQGTLTADEQARFKTLHEQMRASVKDTESKIATLLTAEQKTKLEEIMKERRENRERFDRRRGGFPPANQGNQSPQKPSVTPNER